MTEKLSELTNALKRLRDEYQKGIVIGASIISCELLPLAEQLEADAALGRLVRKMPEGDLLRRKNWVFLQHRQIGPGVYEAYPIHNADTPEAAISAGLGEVE